jgi:hypothetical protein
LAGAFEPIFTKTETRAACCSGVAQAAQAVWRNPGPELRLCAGSTGRSRDRNSMRAREEVLWSGRPLVDVTWFECWWPAAGGNPGSPEESRQSSQRDQHRECRVIGTRAWCRKGGNAQPSPVAHALSFRDAVGSLVILSVYAGSFVGRRFPSLRVRTVMKGETPAMGYGYRRGANLRRVKRWWERGPCPSRLWMATTGSTETQRTPGPVPGCNRPGAHTRSKPSKW